MYKWKTCLNSGGILLSDDGTILEVYKDIPDDLKCEVVDYGDDLVMQSFADMHLHAPQFPMVGSGMDLPLIEWLNTYTFNNEAEFKDVNYARKVYEKLASELIDNGTTRIAMFSSLHVDSTLILMEELEKKGVTGYVGKVNMDRNSTPNLSETTLKSESETIRFINESKRFKNLKPILTPRFTPSCTNELMDFLGKLANGEELLVQSHLSENLNEIEWVKSLHPDCTKYWETYFKYGLWKEKTLMAHCVHSDATERAALKKYNVINVHCPNSNVNLSSGICPVRTFLNEGIWVMLGSDIAGGDELAMYKNIQAAIKVSKLHNCIVNKDDEFLSVAEAYFLATTSSQLYFDGGLGFEKGKKLHAIVVKDANFNMAKNLSLRERFEKSIYAMSKDDIIAVYSEGVKVK